MRKSSSHTPRGNKAGSDSTFKRDGGPKSYSKDSKPSFKKNYDGRSASGDDRPARKAKPYSGRVTDDKPNRSFGKPPFGKEENPRGRDGGPRKGSDSDSRPHRERPARADGDRRSFDRPSFRKEDNKDGGERKPRKEFDKGR